MLAPAIAAVAAPAPIHCPDNAPSRLRREDTEAPRYMQSDRGPAAQAWVLPTLRSSPSRARRRVLPQPAFRCAGSSEWRARNAPERLQRTPHPAGTGAVRVAPATRSACHASGRRQRPSSRGRRVTSGSPYTQSIPRRAPKASEPRARRSISGSFTVPGSASKALRFDAKAMKPLPS